MATYSTLFAATDAELASFAPSWQRPRTTPVWVASTHPFTREPNQIANWVPDGVRVDPEADYPSELRSPRAAIPPILEPAGPSPDYERMLEDGAPSARGPFRTRR